MDKTITLLGFRSFLRVLKKGGIPNEILAQVLTDEIGVYDASEVAYHINELEKTIPVK